MDPGIDGESIVPTLMGRTQPPKEYLFWTWNGNGCEDGSCDPLPPDALLQYPPAGWSVEQGYDGRAFLRNTATGEVSSTNTATAAKQSVGRTAVFEPIYFKIDHLPRQGQHKK